MAIHLLVSKIIRSYKRNIWLHPHHINYHFAEYVQLIVLNFCAAYSS